MSVKITHHNGHRVDQCTEVCREYLQTLESQPEFQAQLSRITDLQEAATCKSFYQRHLSNVPKLFFLAPIIVPIIVIVVLSWAAYWYPADAPSMSSVLRFAIAWGLPVGLGILIVEIAIECE